MRESKNELWAIVAALIAIGVGTMATSSQAENGRQKNEQTIESQLEKRGWTPGSSTTNSR